MPRRYTRSQAIAQITHLNIFARRDTLQAAEELRLTYASLMNRMGYESKKILLGCIMRPGATCFTLVSMALASASTRAVGDLVVNTWLVDAAVYDSTAVGDPLEGVFFETVQNPFQASHTATLNNSYASATYNFAWTGDSANFDVATSHHHEQFSGFTVTEGRINLVPAVDSNVSAWGTWQFVWPSSALGSTVIFLNVVDLESYDEPISAVARGGNSDLGLPYGTLNLQDSGTLLAGRTYEIYYFARVSFFNTAPSGEASGEINFAITPVPEPAALALILPALFLARRRAR
jgi:hypothetical protein